jgi:hypothetical protein
MKKLTIRFLGTLIVLNFLVCGSACVRTKISSLPQPPATAKLRIFVLAVTSEDTFGKGRIKLQWSPEKLNEYMAEKINEHLKIQGIYEVVPSEDIQSVLGNQTIASWEWLAGDWALAKDVGRALHADYALLIERSIEAHMQFSLDLINLNTGKLFQASNYIPWALMLRFNDDERMQACAETIQKNFQQISSDSRKDLLNTAIMKGKLLPGKMPLQVRNITPPENIPQMPIRTDDANAQREDEPLLIAKPEPPPKQKEIPLLTPEVAPSVKKDEHKMISSVEKETQAKQIAFEKELEETIFDKNKKQDGTRLIVYDFDVAERLQIVGLILTEALREELHKLGGFVLVNRENMIQVMEEYKLQHSGLVDEKQSIKMGQWLAANEAVTGMLAPLGATSILQAKRIDIKKMSTIALGSLKCPVGKEDELLDNMPLLARKLVQSQK